MRTVTGLCVPYNVETLIHSTDGGYMETMRPGVFARSLADGPVIPLMSWHDRAQFPLGVAARFTETDGGLVGEFRLTERSAYSMTAWHHIVDRSLSGLSVGFRPVITDWTLDREDRPVRAERLQAELFEVSVCPVPSYTSARITEHRDTNDTTPTPNLDAALMWLDGIKSGRPAA